MAHAKILFFPFRFIKTTYRENGALASSDLRGFSKKKVFFSLT